MPIPTESDDEVRRITVPSSVQPGEIPVMVTCLLSVSADKVIPVPARISKISVLLPAVISSDPIFIVLNIF